MPRIVTSESGGLLHTTSGAALRTESGAVLDVCGEVQLPPTFDNVTFDLGESVANCGCDTNRDAIVRFRAKEIVDGEPSGPYFLSDWESIPKTTGHVRQIEGLTPSTSYRVEIEINALVNPDLDWTWFEDGVTDCQIVLPGPGTPNPEKPVEEDP